MREWVLNPLFRLLEGKLGEHMDKKEVVAAVTKIAAPIVEEAGLELVDVEYVRERDWFLRVYVDKSGGIDIDDCSAVSSKLAKLLDEKDFIKEQYYLEVSSPGIDRPLKKDKDFLANYGKKIDVQLFAAVNGKKQLTGILQAHTAEILTLEIDGKSIELERKQISLVRPHIEF